MDCGGNVWIVCGVIGRGGIVINGDGYDNELEYIEWNLEMKAKFNEIFGEKNEQLFRDEKNQCERQDREEKRT